MKLTIGNKIFGAFGFLIALFIINAGIIFYTGNSIDKVVDRSSEIIRPSKEAINDFSLLITRSKMLSINWVYVQSNSDDKKSLKELHNNEYPALKERINRLQPYWEIDSQRSMIDTIKVHFEKLLVVEKEIMDQLVTFENYEDPLTKLLAEDAIESQVIPMTATLLSNLQVVAQLQQTVNAKSDQELNDSTSNLRFVTILLGIIIVGIGLLAAFLMVRSITKPINFLKEIVVKLGKGELVDNQNRSFNKDEIGQMAEAMDNLIVGLRSTTLFAENIGKGEYNSEFSPLSDEDVLGNALIEMRNNLAKVAEDDKKRNWTTGGLAKFGDILRKNNDDIGKLSHDIISNLVKYLNANQGGLYIIDETDADDPYMVLNACYAWDKKKYINQKVYKGEGLAGQVWQEMDTVYLTEVPDNYISITSGLGEANPRSILIIPLKVNEEIYGVVEIASFNDFADHEISFVEKIGESIASTISSVKINATTQVLLQESQEMTEQMRSQEEEMRQNMEELQATQEEMQRGQSEAENTMEAINEALASAEFDAEGRFQNVNQNFLYMVGYSRDEIIGEHHRILVHKDDKTSDEYKELWQTLSNGSSKAGNSKRMTKSGQIRLVRESFAPIRSRDGSVVKIIMFAADISEFAPTELN